MKKSKSKSKITNILLIVGIMGISSLNFSQFSSAFSCYDVYFTDSSLQQQFIDEPGMDGLTKETAFVLEGYENLRLYFHKVQSHVIIRDNSFIIDPLSDSYSIYLRNCHNFVIENNVFMNSDSIIMIDSSNITVKNNRFESCAFVTKIFGSTNVAFELNEFIDNYYVFEVYSSSSISISANYFELNNFITNYKPDGVFSRNYYSNYIYTGDIEDLDFDSQILGSLNNKWDGYWAIVNDFYQETNDEHLLIHFASVDENFGILAPVHNEVFGVDSPVFTFDFDHNWLKNINMSIDGIEFQIGKNKTWKIPQPYWESLEDGSFSIITRYENLFHDINQITIEIIKDSVKPVLTVIINYNSLLSPQFMIEINDSSEISSSYYTFDGVVQYSFNIITTDNHTVTGEINKFMWSLLPQGNTTVYFYSVDEAGNEGMVEIILSKNYDNSSNPNGIGEPGEFPAAFILTIILGFIVLGTTLGHLNKSKKLKREDLWQK